MSSHQMDKNNKTLNPVAFSIMLAVGVISFPTFAVEGTEEIERITISGKAGSVILQDAPTTVQVMTEEQLTKAGAVEFTDFATKIPGLQFQDLGPGDKKYIIRGVNSTGPSTVGVYFDEAVITGSNANDGGGRNADIRLVDISMIEVLKGPQGSLYGANSMSGLIKYVSNKPEVSDFEAFVEGDLSNTNEGSSNNAISGMVNIPLIDDELALRVVGYRNDDSGFVDQDSRAFGGGVEDVNSAETTGGRVALRWYPSDDFLIDVMYLTQNTEVGGSSRFTPVGSASYGDPQAVPSVTPTLDLTNTDIVRSPWDDDFNVSSITAEYSLDQGTLTGTFNRFERDIEYTFDATPLQYFFGNRFIGQPFGEAATQQPQSRVVDTAEVRYASDFSDGPFQFVVGAFMQKEDSDFLVHVTLVDPITGLPAPFSADPLDNEAVGGTTTFGRSNNSKLKQTSIFGEVVYNFTDELELTLGGRFFDTELSSVEQTIAPLGGGEASEQLSNEFSESGSTFKASLSYQATDDALVYFIASEGFRVGGLNAADIPFAQNSIPKGYGSDELLNLEFGFKTEWFDNAFRLNGALYSIAWDDMQVKAVDDSGGISFTTNAGKARINGLELEANWIINDAFSLDFGASFVNAELTEDQPDLGEGNNDSRGLEGDNIPNVPDVQGFASLNYQRDISDKSLDISANLSYRGDVDTLFRGQNNVNLKSYTLLDFRAALTFTNDLTVALYVKNATDERAQFDGINSLQDPLALIVNRPRTFGINIRKEF